ncbi:dTDP-glucose 4,6-dehydratase [Acidaminobacter sp. JC074]|uniref:dTDP-glucose 4,6-dehydratase n=1 Tax=Acidaminobacter sp. JC074 TaxID=2530199 RepID=UPI001F1046EB|nr:dTDP-glucose 4,6-dehydratase [Acidaminobacter sp. JC074]MCH4888446.1 dTDP-glucose 4,6-dehydratase [Acidaminobacter sp. JC074]
MSKILVTGGAGFIGSYFVKEMKEHDIVVLDKLTYASDLDRIKDESHMTFVEGDICDKAGLDILFNTYDFDIVVNFAAESHVDKSIEDASQFIMTNVFGVQVLMDVCRKHWHKKGLFIQISTDEVYGPSGGEDFDETTPLNPKNPYAASKAAAEHLIKAYENTYDFPSIITRSSNNYGFSQHKEKLIPKTLDNIFHHRPIGLYGDGLQERCWLHVKDHVKAIRKVLEEGRPHEIYNISGKSRLTNLDMVKTIIKAFKKQGFVYKGEIEFITDRPGHDTSYRMTDHKLGYEKKIDMNDGLNEIVSLFMNQNK